MKKQRQQSVASRNTRTRFSSQPKRTTAAFYLPDECWQLVFKFLNNGDDNRYLKTLSLVSKQFLSITNPLLFSLIIDHRLLSFLPRLFHRFTNLTSLVFARNCLDIDKLLSEISCFPLNLTSLDISNQPTIPAIGLRAFSQNITTLTSLTCSKMDSINSNDLLLIAECFPLLEELNLGYPRNKFKDHSNFLNGLETLSLALSKLTRINLSDHYYINDISLVHLFKNCKLLQEVIMFECDGITKAGIFFSSP
ncbi:putative leucine-rich repeat domain, L domain-containing protein [Medicago truncatula]|uniref:Putative leucine-rich repeat domain, L domain-containing protein n=1 Tax=Medicago truncatula TaxID=3880 RepID=A0A396JH11_MEDTR|nr:F-box protein At1g47056 [Medicago truncatula]RHN77546.1 putative leucine-rich repeat domain, L domain-containing protein [Medicago truncatula]